MSAAEWVAVGTGTVTIIGGCFAAIRFIVKHYLAELKPNSGGSVKDQVTRLEARVDKIYELLLDRS